MTSVQELVELVHKLDTIDELQAVNDACRIRSKHIRERDARLQSTQFQKGDRVRIDGLRPKYLSTVVGTIIKVDVGSVTVERDQTVMQTDPRASKYHRNLKIPANCATKITEEEFQVLPRFEHQESLA